MRSPPTSHATLSREKHETNPNNIDLKSLKASLLHSLPHHVSKDIVDVPPGQSLYDVHTERDRRLRLLIRRYVNQIQYGCYNRNCSTSTCLSYRKRNSKVAIRAYTDLSARALACHLIDEHSRVGNDPNRGLCQNNPVVPWYSDPSERHQKSSGKSYEHHGQDQNVFKTSSAPVQHKQRETIAQTQDDEHIHWKKGSAVGLTSVSAGHEYEGDADRGDTHVQSSRSVNETRSPQEQDPYEHAAGRHEHSLVGLDSTTERSPTKKDQASLTQSLWDTSALRQLGTPRCTSDRPAAPRQARSYASRDDKTEGVSSAVTDPFHLNPAFCSITLRRLHWKSLHWLRTTEGAYCASGTPFETFLRQSIHYTLGDPQRLRESADTWARSDKKEGRDVLAQLHAENFDDRQRLQVGEEVERPNRQGQRVSNSCMPIISRQPDLSTVLLAFEQIASLSPGLDGLFSALHAALRSCYTPSERHSRHMPNGAVLEPTDSVDLAFHSSQARAQCVRGPWNSSSLKQVSEVLTLVLLAIVSPLFSLSLAERGFDALKLAELSSIRSRNRVYSSEELHSGWSPRAISPQIQYRRMMIEVGDHLENWHLLRLATSLTNCISHHLAAQAMQDHKRPMSRNSRNIVDMTLGRLCEMFPRVVLDKDIHPRAMIGFGLIEMARSVLAKEWDREAVVKRTSPVGGALELLAGLYRRRSVFYIDLTLFPIDLLAQPFDEMEMPSQWLSFQPSGQQMHILSFPFLFTTATLVNYFRSINATAMRRSHEYATAVSVNARQFLSIYNPLIPIYGATDVLAEMRPHMAKYFVLTIRRSNIVEDAIDQLWRRQRREILRPLRVRLGKDEGEDGLDHGGVQQEFFRLAFAEAFRPEYGLFVMDERTHMTWFQPGSLEPLYKFEALGILMSLAIYNTVTLPITMPLAFYRMLLKLKVKNLEHIRDGWPELTKGLQNLLDFDGDVTEMIGRTYEFTYEFASTTVTIDMQKYGRDNAFPPIRVNKRGKEKSKSASFELPVQVDITPLSQSPPPLRSPSRTSSMKGVSTPLSLESDAPEEAAVITNETREQYIKDYIFWLTDKSIRPQFDAFVKGLFTCIDRTALSLFTPEQLRHVVEGHRDININDLEQTATYEEFESDSPYIQQFWAVVRSFSPDQHRKLLGFVTASDRVPVNGLKSIHFIIQKNGEEDERLPSSSTCYGRLLLPEYSSREILEEKLTKALENSIGFGML